jgi:hypothetical protein
MLPQTRVVSTSLAVVFRKPDRGAIRLVAIPTNDLLESPRKEKGTSTKAQGHPPMGDGLIARVDEEYLLLAS